MNVLAVAGSLRAASINAAFCRAAARLAPPGMHVTWYRELGALPPFNSDLESQPPPAVAAFRSTVDGADALLIASPEYAHGVSGVMKNALDWLVGDEHFIAKPVAVVNTSPRARHAYDSLLEVLRTMSATVVSDASITVPLLGACITEEAMLASDVVAAQIRSALAALLAFHRSGPGAGPSFAMGPA